MPRSQLSENSSFVKIEFQRWVAMKKVQIDHVTCDVTLEYCSVKI